MSIRHLEHLFHPASVAVIGASDRPHSVGAVVMRNLLSGGFAGPIMPVNPKHQAVAAVMAYRDVKSLPIVPDMAVICTPPATVPGLIRELAERGTRAAIVLTAGLELMKDSSGHDLQESLRESARPKLLRVLGPNCVGLVAPGIGLNASFAHSMAQPGGVAFVTQSGALSTAVLDYAQSNDVGLSYFVSLGNKVDVDFGDVLDYLAGDEGTKAILLYIESINDAPKFMSAARAAAMTKPVLAIKAGRVPEGAKAALSHTGAMAGSDDVFDAALRRAGILRVSTIDELFDAVETLGLAKPLVGDRMVILTNGGGPGVMATDALVLAGGRLASLSPATLAKLDAALPRNWSRGNPVDIIGDAPPERYVLALQILLASDDCDAVLFIHAPSAIVPSPEIAKAMLPAIQQSSKTVLACWLGRSLVAQARQMFVDAAIPTYDSPEDAVEALLQISRYNQTQRVRVEAPSSASVEFTPDIRTARQIIDPAMAVKRYALGEADAKAILAAYGIPIVETRVAATPAEAEQAATQIGLPVALKVLSPDITHKSDLGGVVLNLEDARDVRRAAESMLNRFHQLRPQPRLSGFTVQAMVRKAQGHELIVGVATDPIFGPIILFGHGGTAVEVIKDRAIALPPLNLSLAKELIGRTRVSKLLAGYRDCPPADLDTIARVLVSISQLVADLPEVVELDINPLVADHDGALALDARIKLAPPVKTGVSRLSIRPYPRELEEPTKLNGQQLLVRPVRPEDAAAYAVFLKSPGSGSGLDQMDVRATPGPPQAVPNTRQWDR